MTPFMKNICRCYETQEIDEEEKKRICDDIIDTASSYVNPELKTKIDNVIFHTGSNTLKVQHQDLEKINLK